MDSILEYRSRIYKYVSQTIAVIVSYLKTKYSAPLPVLIIGAGVSGLTIGQGLLQRSIPFRIYEANPRTCVTQGHRFRLSNDALSALDSILSPALQELLRTTQTSPSKIEQRYVDAKLLNYPDAVPVKKSDSVSVDRAWLRSLLSLGLENLISYEKRFKRFELKNGRVKVYFEDGTEATGKFLIGADGIKSHVRRQLQPERRLLDLGRNMMWGRIILTPELRKSLPADLFTWMLAVDKEKNRRSIIGPMEWSQSVNEQSHGRLPDMRDYVYFALGTEASDKKLVNAEERQAHMMDMVQDWHPSIKQLLSSADHNTSAFVRVLSSKPDIGAWSTYVGKATLIGDAAHPMSPLGGAGADTAIRDAVEICDAITNGINAHNIAICEEGMKKRAEEKILHSLHGGEKFGTGKKWFEYEEVCV